MFSSEGRDMFSMKYWYHWKTLDPLKKRQNFQAILFFVVSFFASYCCLIFSTTILDCDSFESLNYIHYLKSDIFLVVIVVFFIIFQSCLFLLPCFYCCLFISWMGMMVCLLKASLSMAWRGKFPGVLFNPLCL